MHIIAKLKAMYLRNEAIYNLNVFFTNYFLFTEVMTGGARGEGLLYIHTRSRFIAIISKHRTFETTTKKIKGKFKVKGSL